MNGSIITGGREKKKELSQLVVINSSEGEELWRAPWPYAPEGAEGSRAALCVCVGGRFSFMEYVHKSMYSIRKGVCVEVWEGV